MQRPQDASLNGFVKGLNTALTTDEQRGTSERGRAGLRRLNAYEYENAIRDLLHVPWVQIKSKLPQDGESWRYNKVGTALDVSHVQLVRSMSSAEYALREAVAANWYSRPRLPRESMRGRSLRFEIFARVKEILVLTV